MPEYTLLFVIHKFYRRNYKTQNTNIFLASVRLFVVFYSRYAVVWGPNLALLMPIVAIRVHVDEILCLLIILFWKSHTVHR